MEFDLLLKSKLSLYEFYLPYKVQPVHPYLKDNPPLSHAHQIYVQVFKVFVFLLFCVSWQILIFLERVFFFFMTKGFIFIVFLHVQRYFFVYFQTLIFICFIFFLIIVSFSLIPSFLFFSKSILLNSILIKSLKAYFLIYWCLKEFWKLWWLS